MKFKYQKTDNNGYVALITVLVVLVISVIIGTTLLLLGTDSLRTSAATEDGVKARSAADTCTEIALGLINVNNAFTAALTTVTLGTQGNVSCNYTVTGAAPVKSITVNGFANSATKKLVTTTSQTSPIITISSSVVVP